MKKTKEQILIECTNEHDRKLIQRELDKFENIQKNSHALMMGASLFTVLGIIGLSFGEDYSILCFIPVFPLMLVAMYYNFKSSGLF